MKYIAMIVLDVEDEIDGWKPDKAMIERFLKYSVKTGKIHESAFRGKVLLNVKDVKINVMNVD